MKIEWEKMVQDGKRKKRREQNDERGKRETK